MSANDVAQIVLAVGGVVLPWIIVLCILRAQTRVYGHLAQNVERAWSDLGMITSELLAQRTLAETGNAALAGMMLQHSNAHDNREQQPPPVNRATPVIQPPEDTTQGPHVDAEMLYGGEEEGEMHPPRP